MLKTIWNSWGQPAELTHKLATEAAALHSWNCYVVTIVTHYYAAIVARL